MQLHCCGVESWKDYRSILGLNEVPISCCNPTETAISECDLFRKNPDEQIADQYFYTTVSKQYIIIMVVAWLVTVFKEGTMGMVR